MKYLIAISVFVLVGVKSAQANDKINLNTPKSFIYKQMFQNNQLGFVERGYQEIADRKIEVSRSEISGDQRIIRDDRNSKTSNIELSYELEKVEESSVSLNSVFKRHKESMVYDDNEAGVFLKYKFGF